MSDKLFKGLQHASKATGQASADKMTQFVSCSSAAGLAPASDVASPGRCEV